MSDHAQRVWRAGPVTLVFVSAFALTAAVIVPALAYMIYRNGSALWLPAILILLTVLALLYAWRFGFHPRLRVTDQNVEVINPFRRHTFEWNDITVIAPGENGLLIGSEDEAAEAWCVQKSNFAMRRGRPTRADRIANQLLDVVELYDPPYEMEDTGLRIRRARPDESRLLTRLERAASEDALAHIFPPERYPYPVTDITRRWRHVLRNRLMHAYLLELSDGPVGYVAFDVDTVHHLGVVPEQTRRGYGSALLEFACMEIYAGGARLAYCWVLADNHAARAFYRALGWTETGERRSSEYPPHPQSLQLMRRNPHAPRRSL
ncbi:MAG TPA: GNAT family N-acetyltransferase [Propionibacteriaceae bacterium]|nr:GNAT family N-acetyltransferase [Propionibacteriaceae bacterium]